MATRGRSRQGRSSLVLERLEDGQGQGGGEWELDEINCMDNFLHSWTFYALRYSEIFI